MGCDAQKMDAGTLPGDIVELRLMFDGPAPEARGYSIEQPPRISLDLPFTRSDLPKYNEVGFQNAQSVTVLEAGGRTRLVINLKTTASFTTKTDGNVLYVYVGAEGSNPVQCCQPLLFLVPLWRILPVGALPILISTGGRR